MCGRYSVAKPIAEVRARFKLGKQKPMAIAIPTYNAAPTQQLPVILQEQPNLLSLLAWGLRPNFGASTAPIFNARAETIAEKPTFKTLLGQFHCLVPASGYYEWQPQGRNRVPYFLHLPTTDLFAMAGLYSLLQRPNGTLAGHFTIITVAAQGHAATIHDRMPLILPSPEAEANWLRLAAPDVLPFIAGLQAAPPALISHLAHPDVGKATAQGAYLSQPPPYIQTSIFDLL